MVQSGVNHNSFPSSPDIQLLTGRHSTQALAASELISHVCRYGSICADDECHNSSALAAAVPAPLSVQTQQTPHINREDRSRRVCCGDSVPTSRGKCILVDTDSQLYIPRRSETISAETVWVQMVGVLLLLSGMTTADKHSQSFEAAYRINSPGKIRYYIIRSSGARHVLPETIHIHDILPLPGLALPRVDTKQVVRLCGESSRGGYSRLRYNVFHRVTSFIM